MSHCFVFELEQAKFEHGKRVTEKGTAEDVMSDGPSFKLVECCLDILQRRYNSAKFCNASLKRLDEVQFCIKIASPIAMIKLGTLLWELSQSYL